MTKFWISHECLHLPYEQALTRQDSTSDQYYDCSAHMLWVGERTCQLDGARVEFLRGLHIPTYPNQEELESVLESLAIYPPLVFTEEARKLEDKLADAAVGKAFLLLGGDCAESSMMFKAIHIRDTFNVLMQMAVILTFPVRMPIIKVGRMAGPGSEPFQTKDDVKLSDSFKDEARARDPKKLLQDYSQSVGTLNLLRAFAHGGYASIHGVTQWNLDFVQDSEQGDRYMELAKRVDDAIKFMVAVGLSVDDPIMT